MTAPAFALGGEAVTGLELVRCYDELEHEEGMGTEVCALRPGDLVPEGCTGWYAIYARMAYSEAAYALLDLPVELDREQARSILRDLAHGLRVDATDAT